MIKIGNATINTNVFLAPLSGCSDLAFRLIAREHGAKLCFFEMIDANCILTSRIRTLDIINTIEEDRPIAAQILGSDAEMILAAAEKLLSLINFSFLDVNCACPAKKVIKKKAGAYILQDVLSVSGIIKKLSSSIKLPITVKLRCGFNERDIGHIINVAKACQDSGSSAIFIHGRTGQDGYRGDIDYSSIRAVKEAVSIPVFGSGNILSADLAVKMFDETGCDGILVARGAIGNPWIFREIEERLKFGKVNFITTFDEKKQVLKKHISYVEKHKKLRPTTKVGFMRKIAIWYMRDFPEAKRARERIGKIKGYTELLEIIDDVKTG